jgi:hypothetical protein
MNYKMKKYTQNSLMILIALIVVFGVVHKTRAQQYINNVPNQTINPSIFNSNMNTDLNSNLKNNALNQPINPSIFDSGTSTDLNSALKNNQINAANQIVTSGSSASTNTSAGQTCTSTGITKIICQIQHILNSIVPVLLALGVVYFVWGVIQFMINADNEEKRTKGREKIIYGIIGFAVIVGFWGLVNIIINTFNLSGAAPTGLNVNGTASSACTMGTNFQGLLGFATCVIDSAVIPLIFTIAVLAFIWGVVNFFIINSDEEAKRAQGKQFMIWGIIAIAVMLCVWGLAGILGNTFGINTSVLPHVTPPTQ